MIRINLMPQTRRKQSAESGQGWLIGLLVMVAFEVVGCLVFYSFKQEELDDWAKKNQTVQGEIKISKQKVTNHAEVKAKLSQLRAREEAIAKLQSARTGPTAVLLEIARLMTRGRGPSIDPEKLEKVKNDNPLAMYNPSWDSRRLWLTSFVEDARTVKLTGSARDGDDVSELAKRMNLSSYFHDVRLLPAKREKSSSDRVQWVGFQLEARVRY
jgi:type IV pilus assembly protein PilN